MADFLFLPGAWIFPHILSFIFSDIMIKFKHIKLYDMDTLGHWQLICRITFSLFTELLESQLDQPSLFFLLSHSSSTLSRYFLVPSPSDLQFVDGCNQADRQRHTLFRSELRLVSDTRKWSSDRCCTERWHGAESSSSGPRDFLLSDLFGSTGGSGDYSLWTQLLQELY